VSAARFRGCARTGSCDYAGGEEARRELIDGNLLTEDRKNAIRLFHVER
jgi:hypothetical protein